MEKHIKKAFEVGGLRPVEKLVLLTLAYHADEAGRCWLSQSLLMAETGVGDERTLWSAVKSLEQKELIIVARGGFSYEGGSKRQVNFYRLTLPRL